MSIKFVEDTLMLINIFFITSYITVTIQPSYITDPNPCFKIDDYLNY